MKNDRTIEFSLHMKVRNWSRPPSPPSQCWKLKCCQTHKFDHQHKIQHWSEGGRGSKSSRKLSHLYIFGAAWSAKVCRVILLKLAGSDFELSHTIFKCWQTHEIHHLECRVKREKVQKYDEHDVLSDAIDAQNAWLFFTFGATLGNKLSVQGTLRAFGRSRAPLYA